MSLTGLSHRGQSSGGCWRALLFASQEVGRLYYSGEDPLSRIKATTVSELLNVPLGPLGPHTIAGASLCDRMMLIETEAWVSERVRGAAAGLKCVGQTSGRQMQRGLCGSASRGAEGV